VIAILIVAYGNAGVPLGIGFGIGETVALYEQS
jgi:hypothetical protein